MILWTTIVIVNFLSVSGFGCYQTCHNSDGVLCSSSSLCEAADSSSHCFEKQCLVMVVDNIGTNYKELTLINTETSNLMISSIEQMEHYPGFDDCNVEKSVIFKKTTLTIAASCKMKLLVCVQLTCDGVIEAKHHADDCQIMELANDGPMNIISLNSLERPISSIKHISKTYDNKHKCIPGQTYGFYKTSVFTRKRCAGEFQVCFESSSIEKKNSTTEKHEAPAEARCTDIRLSSHAHRPVELKIKDILDNDVEIQNLTLVHQYTKVACIKDVNYSFSYDVIHIWGGCYGTFKLCFHSKQ